MFISTVSGHNLQHLGISQTSKSYPLDTRHQGEDEPSGLRQCCPDSDAFPSIKEKTSASGYIVTRSCQGEHCLPDLVWDTLPIYSEPVLVSWHSLSENDLDKE